MRVEGDICIDLRPDLIPFWKESFLKEGKFFLLCDARKLPFKGGSFMRVHARHLLEHFSWREVNSVLSEWIRVLKPRGSLELYVPNLRSFKVLNAILRGNSYGKHDFGLIYGFQDYPENFHKSGFTPKVIRELLKKHNLYNIAIRGEGEHDFLPLFNHRYVRWLYRKLRLTKVFQHWLPELHVIAMKR